MTLENSDHLVEISYSQYIFLISDQVKTVDIFLQLRLDFEKHILDGSATLTVERIDQSATHLVSEMAKIFVPHCINTKDK